MNDFSDIAIDVTQLPKNVFYANNWQRVAFADRSRFLILAGAAGTGKSRLAAEKVVATCRRFSDVDALIVRKTEKSLINSTIAMIKAKVLAGADDVIHVKSENHFKFSNGSTIFYSGMANEEQVQQLRSIGKDGALDLIWIEEANRATYNDFNTELRSRLRGKQLYDDEGNIWQQAIFTTNADSFQHWINQQFILPAAANGKHYHIPIEGTVDQHTILFKCLKPSISVFQPPFGSNKFNPESYHEDMLTTTGLANKRMVKGLWVNAEGVVYDTYSYDTHVINSFLIPEEWQRYVSIDWGSASPASVQWWARSPEDVMYLYRESYKIGMDAEQIADMINYYSTLEPKPRYCVVDYSDPSGGRQILQRRGISTVNADKTIERGIQVTKQRMAVDMVLGKPKIQFFADALIEEDRRLKDKNRPLCTTDEIETYQWADDVEHRNFKEIPLQVNDHGCLVGTTLIKTNIGDVRLKNIALGDQVLTRDGYRKVVDKRLTNNRAKIWEVHFTVEGHNNKMFELKGTHDHPVFVVGRGWTPIRDLRRNMNLVTPDGKRATVTLVTETLARRAVYNLTVEDNHEYYADGVLVHNCDAMRYMMMNIYNMPRGVFSLNLGDVFDMAGLD